MIFRKNPSRLSVRLWYGGWSVVGSIPSSWGSLTQLEYVGLELNRLSGERIWCLNVGWKCTSNLFSWANSIQWCGALTWSPSGTLPSSWGALASVKYIGVSENSLTGLNSDLSICYCYSENCFAASTQQWCALVHTFISGTLPSSWGNLTAVQYILCSVNALTGWFKFQLIPLPNY